MSYCDIKWDHDGWTALFSVVGLLFSLNDDLIEGRNRNLLTFRRTDYVFYHFVFVGEQDSFCHMQ